MLGQGSAAGSSKDRRGLLQHVNWRALESRGFRLKKEKAILREKTGFAFPVKQLELHLDTSNLGGRMRVKGVVLDVVALGTHVPSHIESLLYQGDNPSVAGILLLQRINISLLRV